MIFCAETEYEMKTWISMLNLASKCQLPLDCTLL